MNRIEKRPTIRDVARVAGVSVGSVSRVLNGDPTVGKGTRAAIQAAIAQLGFEPSPAAQNMRRQSTGLIGFIISDIAAPDTATLVKSAQQVLFRANYMLMLANYEHVTEDEARIARALSRRRVDGLFWWIGSEVHPLLREVLREIPIPVVLIDRDMVENHDAVSVDHFEGLRQATEHLLNLGHRRIALITGSEDIRPSRERIRGYRHALTAWGLNLDPSLVRARSPLPDHGFQQSLALLSSRTPPTAIISASMGMLPGVLRAVRARGKRIPEDVSIISVGDSDLAELFSPAVTVVRWSLSEVGRLAAELILERLQGERGYEARMTELPTEFVLRGSCAPTPEAAAETAGRGPAASRKAAIRALPIE